MTFNATNFVLYAAGTLLCALSIYAFLAAICKMVLSFSSVMEAAELAETNEELEAENDELREENAALQGGIIEIMQKYDLETPLDEALRGQRTADDVEAEAEQAGGCNGHCGCGG